MTKIPSVEERVEEFDEFLDKYTGKHEENGLYATPFADCVKVRKDIIVKEFLEALIADRTALLTELRGNLLLNELPIKNEWVGGYNTLARAMKAHLDELIKSNSV